MCNAIWSDYNPLDGTVEYGHQTSNITTPSDQDRLHEIIYQEPKRVRYDDGWIAVYPPLRQTYNPISTPTTTSPTKQPTAKPSRRPTPIPTAKPSKKPTLRPTSHPITSNPTESPTNKWWANTTSPHSSKKNKKSKQKSDAAQLRKEHELLSPIAVTNIINIYNINLNEKDLFIKTLKRTDLMITQTLSPYESSFIGFMRLFSTAVYTPSSINYAFLAGLIQRSVHRMAESQSTQIVFEATMKSLQVDYNYLNKSQATKTAWYYILQSMSTTYAKPSINPDHYTESATVWLTFISISMQKLADNMYENVLTLFTEQHAHLKNAVFPSEIIQSIAVQLKSKINAKIDETISMMIEMSIKADDHTMKLNNLCANFLLDAWDLINMRSEILALQQLYVWRVVQKQNGIVSLLMLKTHCFIPLTLRMGYAADSIHLFDVFRNSNKIQNGLNKHRQQKLFDIKQLTINFSLPYVKEIVDFEQNKSSPIRRTKKKQKKATNTIMNACKDVINIYAVKNIEEHLNFFENELMSQEKSDLVITTGLTGYGCEGLLPSISNLTKGRFVGVYYNDLGAIYERLMQFILIMERGLVETAYPEQIGRIIHLMKRMKYRGLFSFGL